MPAKKRDAKWQNDYIRRTYDRLHILVPQGQKATVEQAAEAVNESVNQYTNRAILERMGLKDWPKKD